LKRKQEEEKGRKRLGFGCWELGQMESGANGRTTRQLSLWVFWTFLVYRSWAGLGWGCSMFSKLGLKMAHNVIIIMAELASPILHKN
jgi:hypothetical protein